MGAPAEGQDIVLELAFDYHKLQAPDSWLIASVQAGLPLPFFGLLSKRLLQSPLAGD